MSPAKKPVWVSAKGEKHRVDPDTGKAPCGLRFSAPYPACNRSDPMCKGCITGMRQR